MPLPLFLPVLFLLGPAGPAAPPLSPLQEAAMEQVRDLAPAVQELADRLWTLAETGLQEEESARLVSGALEAGGFTVRRGAGGLSTAFVASWGRSGPVIGLLADYDALPDVGNQAVPRREARTDGVSSGHACGHNLIAAGAVAAALAVKQVLQANHLPGTVRVYGTPAEESKVGKVYLAKARVFDHLDACLTWHPASRTAVGNQAGTALNDFTVEFLGTSAHSAAEPWEGRSALDALEMFNFGVNLLREHIRPTARIQYVIQEGGATPRDVPDRASAWYWIRDISRPRVESLFDRIRKVAEGAAAATETEARLTLLTGVHPILLNRPLQEALQRNLATVGLPEFSDEDLAFGDALQAALGVEAGARGFDTRLHPLSEGVDPPAAGSNDLAEVSWLVPTARFLITAAPRGVPLHAWPASACFGTPMGGRAAVRAAQVLALTVLDLLTREDLRRAARTRFEEQTEGRPYRSPVAGNQGIPGVP